MLTPAIGICLGALFTVARAQEPKANSADFCSISMQSVTKADDKLYIIGGWMLWSSRKTAYSGPNNFLRSIDLGVRFQTTDNFDDYAVTDSLPNLVPRVSRPAWWNIEPGYIEMLLGRPENEDKALWGSQAPVDDGKKLRYEINTGVWTSVDIILDPSVHWDSKPPALPVFSYQSVWVPGVNKGYSLGGNVYKTVPDPEIERDWYQDSTGIGYMLAYDLETNTWTNETTPFKTVDSVGAKLTHLKTADDNVLIRFGGTVNGSYASMSEIDIYSTKKSRWYKQILPMTSTAPAPRADFCTAVVSAADNSSHQIIMVGGVEADGTGSSPGPAALSIWALSIPTFDWVELPIKPSNLGNPFDGGLRGRVSPSCEIIGEHYLFLYGGRKLTKFYDTPICDTNGNAAFLLDLNTLAWTDTYLPDSGHYRVMEAVTNVIGGVGNGTAAKTVPDGGFSNDELPAIMQFTTGPPTIPGTAPAASGNTTSTGSQRATTENLNVTTSNNDSNSLLESRGTIIGGYFVGALVSIVFWL